MSAEIAKSVFIKILEPWQCKRLSNWRIPLSWLHTKRGGFSPSFLFTWQHFP